MRLLLVNPNTNAATTVLMAGIARAAAPQGVSVEGATVTTGAPLITTPEALTVAAEAVLALVRAIADPPDGVIVAAFGDPGLDAARALLPCPVVGIAEAGMAAAAAHGRFGVATTTPELVGSIHAMAERLGHAQRFTGTRVTAGDPHATMADPARLEDVLAQACLQCRDADGAAAVVIGGGPLAAVAQALSTRLAMPVIAPIPAAVDLLLQRIAFGR
jgi:Asp/Glu/hydantoin racemase